MRVRCMSIRCWTWASAPRASASGPWRKVRSLTLAVRMRVQNLRPTLLTNFLVKNYDDHVLDVQVIDNPASAMVALDPARSRLLAELSRPASAAALAARLGLARQK